MPDASANAAQPMQRPPLQLSAGRIQVEFYWYHDRWAHRISIDGQPVWESLEGPRATLAPGISDRWPASPVFTEIMPTETASGPAVLGVGLAGRSHFSASLTAAAEIPDTLLVELACRLHEPPGWLGSVYSGLAVPVADAQAGPISICPAPVQAGRMPFTASWTYRIGPAGIEAVPPASCESLPNQAD